jgi:2-polyprenyl-3-methyl-5-hydroxy-6-metoxy-1,4-benzoquinol methylase
MRHNLDTRASGKTEQLRNWYDANAAKFKDAAAIEGAFTEMTDEEQSRLNRFKLWHLEHGNALSLLGKRVLEFGCGHGRMAIELPGYESYLGVDFCADLVRFGQERIARAGLADRARLVVSDCLTFDGPREYFDVVCSLGMFAFVENAEAVLRKMSFHLKPGGTLFIDGHHASPLYNVLRRWRWRWVEPSGGLSHMFSKREIRSLFAGVGLLNQGIVMREYPLLGKFYACRHWDGALRLRNELAQIPWLDVFGTDFIAIATKPT